jgi:antitoxin VapB
MSAIMALNIKSKEAHELAAELASLTGKSMTTAVIDALHAALAEQRSSLQKEVRAQELMEIGRRCAAHLHQPVPSVQHGDILYDERGLPQ